MSRTTTGSAKPAVRWRAIDAVGRCLVLLVLLLVGVSLPIAGAESRPVASGRLADLYPHWRASDLPFAALLERQFQKFRGQDAVILSDFDGTLVDEEWESATGVRCSGQAAWHIWGACHLDAFPRLFPKFDPGDRAGHRRAILEHNAVLEGWTPVVLSPWIKFYEIGTFEAGMTPGEMDAGLKAFFQADPPARHVFLPMLDLLQRALDLGFRVWIVSGSNPRFITAFFAEIRGKIEYQPGRTYSLDGLVVQPYHPCSAQAASGARVIGNMARVRGDGTFADLVDDRFVAAVATEPLVIEGRGKTAAVCGYIDPIESGPMVLALGNSDGDYEMSRFVLESSRDGLVVLVNPRGKTFPTLAGTRGIRLEQTPVSPSFDR